jgi:predicted metal-dependent hydrolase
MLQYNKIQKDYPMKPSTPPTIDYSTLSKDYAGSPLETIFYQSLSVLFSGGESYFCRAVQAYRDDLPLLAPTINEFCKQEVQHSRVHRLLNSNQPKINMVIETRVDKTLRKVDRLLPRSVNLQTTVILEHLTASLADIIIRDPVLSGRLDDSARDLWLYHAKDEIEHEHVALDVAIAAGCPVLLRQALTPVVYTILIAVLINNHLLLIKDRKSISGLWGWGRLVGKMISGVEWSAPMRRGFYCD